ncbi:MAG: type II secretion system F family protein [Patescibacteria group bacterium]|nr:type II secretion system F family protein [Patescibacteria group bacterium]
MLYHYRAADQAGKIVEDDFDANAVPEVLQYLASKSLRPIAVKSMESKTKWFGAAGKITVSDKVFLAKYLALMLRVGTDLLSAVEILIADFDKPAVRRFLLEVRENLRRGQPFYVTFEQYKKVFSPTFVSLVKAAEASGNLQRTFEDLTVSLEKEADLRNRVRGALIYPVVLLGMSLAILLFLVTFALPKVATVFSGSGVNPPAFSAVVFAVGLFIGNNVTVILGSAAAIVVALFVFIRKSETGKRIWSRSLMRLPVIKSIYRDLAIQQMASTMSALMKAGLPIVESVNVAAETVSLPDYRLALQRVASEGLAKGFTIGEAFKREEVFPRSVTSLIAISEKAGHLDEVLKTLADFYSASVDASIKGAVSLLEPLLLVVMGVVVAVIALAIIVPIYQLTTSFS